MRYPWANVLLLLLMALELVTGYLGLTSGTPQWVAALHLHRIGGFAIVALLLWKGRNILPPLTRLRRWRRLLVPHLASLLLFALLLSSLALGMAWSHTGPYYFMGFSGVSWHIYLAVAMLPIVLWHTIFHRSTLRPQFWAERRSFLRLGGLLVAGLVLWRAGELGTKVLGLAGSQRRFTGSYTASSFSGNNFPETSWINDNPPAGGRKNLAIKSNGPGGTGARDPIRGCDPTSYEGHRYTGLHRWLVHRTGVGGSAVGGGAGGGGVDGGRGQRDGALGDRVLPALFSEGGPFIPTS